MVLLVPTGIVIAERALFLNFDTSYSLVKTTGAPTFKA